MTDAAPSAVLTGFEKQAAEAVLTRAGVEQDEVRAAEVIWDRDHVLRLELADGRSVVLKRRRDEEDAGNQGFETELAALELSEIDQITPMLREKGNLSLVHGDPCPDNVLLFEDGCRIFDFEISGWSSVVLDAAYLLAPFPSCWCFADLPAEVAAPAIDAYREILGAAGIDLGMAWDAGVAAAVAGWIVARGRTLTDAWPAFVALARGSRAGVPGAGPAGL